MSLVTFLTLIHDLPPKQKFKVAGAAYRLMDLMQRGLAVNHALAIVLARRDHREALLLSGRKSDFESITAISF